MPEEISVQFTRFSAFYTPLLATIAGGFLAAEGFRPRHSVAPPGRSAIEGLVDGTVHVCQSAPSQAFGPLGAPGSWRPPPRPWPRRRRRSSLITRRHRYEDAVAPPPDAT